jgi:16S rRNA (uracil1498-N3)-methyltransferase
MSVARFHVEGAAPGAHVILPEWSAHHAREVLRLRAGASVRVFDGAGEEYEATLDQVSRQAVTARLGHRVEPRPESSLRVVLALSALKGDRMELVIQKATELGVAEVRPIVTARTDAAARPALKGSRQDRWEKVASGAAEQCGRAVVPRIAPTALLADLLAEPFEGTKLLLLEPPGGSPLLVEAERPSAVLLLVGPAGGWADAEVESITGRGFRAVALGPRVLRSETAALAAVVAVQALWGDLAGR